MLDIKLIREHPEVLIEDLRKRQDSEKMHWVEEIIGLDRKIRDFMVTEQDLRRQRNELTARIAELKKKGEDAEGVVEESRKIPDQIKSVEDEKAKVGERMDWLMQRLPNITHESVPYGVDDSGNVEVRKWGSIPEFAFKSKDHIELGEALDVIDIERGAKVSGARFYYLKGDAAMLEMALAKFTMDTLVNEEGFTPFIPPVLVRPQALFGTGFLPAGEQDIYKIEGEDLRLVGTAEVPLGSMHMDETFSMEELPKHYAGFSSCFRTEAGSHGRDTKGIFRVHQFEKVEMFKFTTPESSWSEHETLLASAEKLYQKLGLPYHVVNICTGDLGVVAAKKYDIEVWLPGQGKYREVASCSNCTDYQARRLNIRFRRKPHEKAEYVHTLNSTAVAISRTIVAILENYQQEDGSVRVPEVLIPYMNGKKVMRGGRD